jgi:tetratricopeptide (TPR) repeat protein
MRKETSALLELRSIPLDPARDKMDWLFPMRVIPSPLPLVLIACLAGLSGRVFAQEPSAALKQADADFRAGVAALNRNDLKAAEAKFASVVRLAPGVEQGHSALGAVLVREGQMEVGIRELEKALAIKASDSSAQMNLALAYAQTGAGTKALPLFAKVEAAANAQKQPLPAAVLATYARTLATTGHSAAAIARMKEAVAQDAGNASLRDDLGSLYAQGQDWPHAEEQFSAAIRLQPGFATAHLHIGLVYLAEKKPDFAKELMQASTLAPADAQIALAAGKALADAGQDERAAPVLEQAMRLEPGSAAAAYQLALVLQRVNRVADAIPLLRHVVEADPKNPDALINLGLALSQQHQAKDAVPYLQRAIALEPESATAHQDLAAAYLQINQVDDGIAELKAALRLSPDEPQLHYNLGAAYKLEDDATDAIPELETAEKLDRSAYEPAYVLGLLYMQVARYAEAATQLETSLKLQPDNGDGWATLGSVYNKLDRLPEASAALREATKQLPDQADPHLTLAAVLVKQNQPAEAAEERKLAANLMRAHMNLQRAEVATNSGKSLMANGKTDDAVAQFREALTFDPKYAEAHLELAKALEKQGKTEEAAAERAQAGSVAKPAQ